MRCKAFLKDFFINLFFSAVIGIIIGIINVLASLGSSVNIYYALSSFCIAGMVIGSICEIIYYYLYEIKQLGIKLTLVAIFVFILAILYGLFVLQFGFIVPNKEFFIMLIIVETLSIGYSILEYMITKRYNKKLAEKKKQFQNRHYKDTYQ